MRGPAEYGSPFFAFMKARGQSRKDSETAGGSYGIGKLAPYAVSKIRTIFVSTVFRNQKGRYLQYTQGKSILMSHDDPEGRRRQATGYWGEKEKCRPVVGFSDLIPDWIQRARGSEDLHECGTKLTILGFERTTNWHEELAIAVAENFFGAIAEGELSVDIDGQYELSKGTIEDFFNNDKMRHVVEERPDELDQFENSRYYLATLLEDNVLTEESQTRELGNVQVRILVDEGLPKKVCFLRNGMFITDSLERLKTFSDFKDFVAVVRCLSASGNRVLRDMEPPRHNNFEPERRATKKDQKTGRQALKDIAFWIREMLARHAKDPVSEVTQIDELKQFFFEEGADGSGDGVEDINPYGEVLIQAKPIRANMHPKIEPSGSDGSGGAGGVGKGKNDTSEHNTENGAGKSGTSNGEASGADYRDGGTSSKRTTIDLRDVRTIATSGKKRRVAFTPAKSGTISLNIKEAGADSDYDTAVTFANVGKIDNGSVVLKVTENLRCVLDIELSRDFEGAIKVVGYGI